MVIMWLTMKVALATVLTHPQVMPLALLYLKACLVEQRGCAFDDVATIAVPPACSPEELTRQVLETTPDIVGLSCYVWNVTTLMDVARRLRAARPDLRIVAGGPEVGPRASALVGSEPALDVVVRDEGEIPFGEIVEHLARGQSLDDVAGISFRRGDDVIDTPDAPLNRDLNEIASPHQDRYMASQPRSEVYIETQRGCVFKCNFCFYNKGFAIRNRRFDLDRVKREILYWLERDPVEIFMMDPVFNLNAARAKEICRFIAEHNTRGIPFHAELWAEFVDEELAQLMRAAHFTWVEVGLQTTDEVALQSVERRLRMEPFLAGMQHLKRAGIDIELQLIHGLPNETPDTFRRSLDFAATLDAADLKIFTLMVLPGTELWRKVQEFQLDYDPAPPYYIRSHPSMSAADIAHGVQMKLALRRLYPSRTIRLLAREPGASMSQILDAWIARLESGRHPGEDPRQFVAEFCASRSIPAGFYEASAAKELVVA
jgi:anaerobic magnesium-protoporphyrin IX monomethyl ester cyclase